MVEAIKDVIESTPPEIVGDIVRRGIHLAGGGALIKGLPEFLSNALGVQVVVAPDPLTAVVRGTGIILNDMNVYMEVIIPRDDELVPTQ